MQLQLKYQESVKHEVRAAFVRATKPEAWLGEISRWGLSPGQLSCYVLPQSIANLQAAGLFVVFKDGMLPATAELLEPYGVLVDKLYVPQHTTMYPEVGAEELKRLLLWDLQVYHPSIGLIGFDKADVLDLADLLHFEEPQPVNWSLARLGVAPKPRIKQISVQQLTVEEVLENFKKSIDPKALEDIPEKEDEKSTPLSRAVDSVKRVLLKGALGAYQGLKRAFSDDAASGSSANATAHGATPGAPGFFQRLENWMLLNLEELERKRNAEINRLLNLFEENSDEALRYAIPLDSPYLNRGTAASPGYRLTRGNLDFSLGRLGGGGVVDSWDVGNYYSDLRTKYQRTAQKELDAQHYQKAAYIYAHLLGDYYSAAKALEQGKFYREAAALYKDHLNNKASAAECLERGGLLVEAIELYGELGKYEKVADLYKELGQEDVSAYYYERCVEQVMKNSDYLDASRIIVEKLEQPQRGRELLLKGWSDLKQSESCLQRYFDLSTARKEALCSEVQEVYVKHTPKTKRSGFLNLLLQLNQQKRSEELLDTSRNLAYEIISEEALEGNVENMYSLKKFLQDDRLISSDLSRFINSAKPKVLRKTLNKELQLDRSIKWFQVINHRNQYLALGRKGEFLHLARGNWYGNFEYYSWTQSIQDNGIISMLAEPYSSQQIILRSAVSVVFEQKKLPKNKYFDDELIVGSHVGISDYMASMAINEEGTINALKVHPSSGAMDLLHFDAQDTLWETVPCKAEGEQIQLEQISLPATMICRGSHYYFFYENWLMTLDNMGVIKVGDVHSYIYNVIATEQHAELKLAVATDAGMQIMYPIKAADMLPATDHFANGFIPLFMKFISSETLVIADQEQAIVFDISINIPQELQRVQSPLPIVGILAASKRNQFALLEESGKINVHEINRG